MDVRPLGIADCFVASSPVWGDERGFFREWHKLGDLPASWQGFVAAQANLSSSATNVVRGLHYSLAPEGQAKIVTCVGGALVDVICDVRVGSPTYGVVELVPLAADRGDSVLLPAGVAHGFCVPEGPATLAYLLSSPYRPDVELEIDPFDEDLAVSWPIPGSALLSPKDAAAPSLAARGSAGELPIFTARS